MAFSTIQGSGGAPDSFVGTSGVDAVTIVDSTGNFFLGAQQSGDSVNFVASRDQPGVITGATLKGGQGADSILGAGLAAYTGVYVNGNSDSDTLNFGAAAVNGSTIHGGQAGDTIASGNLVASLLNGNKDADTIGITSAASSTIYGGQGADTVVNIGNVTSSLISLDLDDDTFTAAAVSLLTNSTIAGGQGNDTINNALAGSASVIEGGEGTDILTGANAADTISGGDGADTIATTGGSDVLSGGAGADRFVINTNFGGDAGVSITDFGGDALQISVAAQTGTGSAAATRLGGASFSVVTKLTKAGAAKSTAATKVAAADLFSTIAGGSGIFSGAEFDLAFARANMAVAYTATATAAGPYTVGYRVLFLDTAGTNRGLYIYSGNVEYAKGGTTAAALSVTNTRILTTGTLAAGDISFIA